MLYMVVGEGTAMMSEMEPVRLSMFSGLSETAGTWMRQEKIWL